MMLTAFMLMFSLFLIKVSYNVRVELFPANFKEYAIENDNSFYSPYISKYIPITLKLDPKDKHFNPFRKNGTLIIGMQPGTEDVCKKQVTLLSTLIKYVINENNLHTLSFSCEEIACAGLSLSTHSFEMQTLATSEAKSLWNKIIHLSLTESSDTCIHDLLDFKLNEIIGYDITLNLDVLVALIGTENAKKILEFEENLHSSEVFFLSDAHLKQHKTTLTSIFGTAKKAKESFESFGIHVES